MLTRIAGTGYAVPRTVRTNAELIAGLAPNGPYTTDAWIQEHLGIRERRVLMSESLVDLAVQASLQALITADLAPAAIDLIIVATTTPERVAPSTASLVAARLGAPAAVAFDLAAVCSGWMYALAVAQKMLTSSLSHHALVIGADAFSHITDFRHRDCVYFGDGAGAVVIAQGPGSPLWDMRLFAHADNGQAFTILPGASTYVMDGPAVKHMALEVLPGAVRGLLTAHDLTMADIKWLVPHQAGIGVLRALAEALTFPFTHVLTSMTTFGNTAAASIPLTLARSAQEHMFRPGEYILLVSIGAGWTWAVGLMSW